MSSNLAIPSSPVIFRREPQFIKSCPSLNRIECVNAQVEKVKGLIKHGLLFKALPLVKDLLVQEAHWTMKAPCTNKKVQLAYKQLRNNILALQKHYSPELVAKWVDNVKDTPQLQERSRIARWALSTADQRDFAAYYNRADVPLKYSEIPAGSVLIHDPFAYLMQRKYEGKKSFFITLFYIIKAIACRLATGMRFNHAELAMGKGLSFDLDKQQGTWIQGVGYIKERKDEIFYGVVVAPDQEKMLLAHNETFPKSPCNSFSDLIHKMNSAIRRAVLHKTVHLHAGDVIKTALPAKRPAGYDSTKVWQGGACQYSCSGTTSALFSYLGIDIGKQFGKPDRNITPTNFFQSHFFKPLFTLS